MNDDAPFDTQEIRRIEQARWQTAQACDPSACRVTIEKTWRAQT